MQNKNPIYEEDVLATPAQPNTHNLIQTGTGEQILNTPYSWDIKGQEQAAIKLQQDELMARQDSMKQATEIQRQGTVAQDQFAMEKYTREQSLEKAGWTGGYVLDQKRQMEYLKTSIAAQMYSALELQKYGFATSLAAARMSYDLNLLEYARNYYNDAVAQALQEQQVTGRYYSAELTDALNQRFIAQQTIEEGDRTGTQASEAYKRAEQVLKNVDAWMGREENEEGDVTYTRISPEGIKTMSVIQNEQRMAWDRSQELWIRYNAASTAANKQADEDVDLFIKVDANGQEVYDGNKVLLFNFRTANQADVLEYMFGEGGTSSNTAAIAQYRSYLEGAIGMEIARQFRNHIKGEDWLNDDGTVKSDHAGQIESEFTTFLLENDLIAKELQRFDNADPATRKKLQDVIAGWTLSLDVLGGRIDYTPAIAARHSGSTVLPDEEDAVEGQTHSHFENGKLTLKQWDGTAWVPLETQPEFSNGSTANILGEEGAIERYTYYGEKWLNEDETQEYLLHDKKEFYKQRFDITGDFEIKGVESVGVLEKVTYSQAGANITVWYNTKTDQTLSGNYSLSFNAGTQNTVLYTKPTFTYGRIKFYDDIKSDYNRGFTVKILASDGSTKELRLTTGSKPTLYQPLVATGDQLYSTVAFDGTTTRTTLTSLASTMSTGEMKVIQMSNTVNSTKTNLIVIKDTFGTIRVVEHPGGDATQTVWLLYYMGYNKNVAAGTLFAKRKLDSAYVDNHGYRLNK